MAGLNWHSTNSDVLEREPLLHAVPPRLDTTHDNRLLPNPVVASPKYTMTSYSLRFIKIVCFACILTGLTLTGYFIYQGTVLAPSTQFLFAIVIQAVYVVIYPIMMLLIDPKWSTFMRHTNELGLHRALLCGVLWAINNVFITVPASHLSGFYQMLGITMSFIGCYIIEMVVQGTVYTKAQSVSVVASSAIFVLLAAADPGLTLNGSTVFWFICYLLNQIAASYAQVLMENAWKKNPGEELYKVMHGNFLTNLLGMPFFLAGLPFYFSQHDNLDSEYLWIPVVIAISATIYTIGSNVLLQFEDMTYSMMASTVTNATTLLMIVLIPWNKGTTNKTEVTAYICISLFAFIYMTDSSDHAGRQGNKILQANFVSHALILTFLITALIVILGFFSKLT